MRTTRTPTLNVACILSILFGAACGEDQPRTEPPPASGSLGCRFQYLVCQQQPDPPLVDGHDPRWAYCSAWHPANRPSMYSPGSIEITWAYDDAGGIDRVDLQCSVDILDTVVTPERDADGRVVRWQGGGPAIELTYDEGGMLAARQPADERFYFTVSSFQYRDDGKLATIRGDTFLDGVLVPEESGMSEVEYESGELVSITGGGDTNPCRSTTTYVREAGRVVRVVNPGTCSRPDRPPPFAFEHTYEWSGAELQRSRTVFDSDGGEDWEEETRYSYERGRIVEVQRDRDGSPQATYWLDYDDEGRLTHLLWWGHNPEQSY